VTTTAALPAQPARVRDRSLDALRGIAILLLLVLHACEGMSYRTGLPGPEWMRPFNGFFMPFRMPTLMLVSGMLLAPSLAKPLDAYVLQKLRNLAWPYLVWCTVLLLSAGWAYFETYYLTDPSAWISTGYLWYLFYLLVFTLVAPLTRRLPAWMMPVACLVAANALPLGLELKTMAYYATCFFLGDAITRHRARLWPILRRPAVLGAMAAVGIGFGLVVAVWAPALAWSAPLLPLNLAGAVAAAVAIERATTHAWIRPFAWLGERSVVVYATHWPIMLATSLLLVGAGLAAWTAPANLAATLAIAIPLAAVAHRRPWRWLFQAPFLGSWVRRRTAARSVAPARASTRAAPAPSEPTRVVDLPPVPPTPPLPAQPTARRG
jgi:fucose 4-O-acetylase-like acetyltransferase